jgi:hypothetical protein
MVNAEFVDMDIVNDIIANTDYLNDALTLVQTTSSTNGKRATGDTYQFKIVAGVSVVPTFKGAHSYTFKFNNTHTGAATAQVIPVFYHSGGANVNVVIKKVTKTDFTVTLYPASSKTTIKGARLFWIAIHER